jgi:hypothetical protein
MRGPSLACAVLVIALSFVAARARAVAPASSDDPPLVELAFSCPSGCRPASGGGSTGGEAGDAVSARVESWFRGRVPVARVTAAEGAPRALPAPADHAGIRVWIALEEATTARVLFAVQRRPEQAPRYLVSDVPVEEGLDELGVERLGQIVYLSAMALWEGNVESSTEEVKQWLERRPSQASAPVPAPEPVRAPPTPAATPAPARWAVRVGAEYAAIVSGDEGVSQAVGADVAALRAHGASALGPRLRAAVLVPHAVSTSGVTLDLRGTRFGLGAALDRKVGSRVRIPAEIGVALDVVRYRASAFVDPSYRADAGGTDVRPLAYARCGVRVDFGGVGFGVAAVGFVDLVRAHYDVVDNGRRSAVVTPWPVRPGLSAGASW